MTTPTNIPVKRKINSKPSQLVKLQCLPIKNRSNSKAEVYRKHHRMRTTRYRTVNNWKRESKSWILQPIEWMGPPKLQSSLVTKDELFIFSLRRVKSRSILSMYPNRALTMHCLLTVQVAVVGHNETSDAISRYNIYISASWAKWRSTKGQVGRRPNLSVVGWLSPNTQSKHNTPYGIGTFSSDRPRKLSRVIIIKFEHF